MKKVISTIIVIAMLAVAFFAFGSTALAAGESLNVSTTVSELLEGAVVDFTATVTAGDTNLVGYKITCNGNTCYNSDGATLLANNSAEVSFSMQVTTEMLGNPISFVLADDSSSNIITDSVTIAKKAPTITLAASGKANKTLAAKGDVITFTISLENQGDVRLDDIVVSAPELNDGDPFRDAFSLEPTQSFDVIYKHTMDKEMVVHPVVKYKYNGVEQEAKALDPIELTEESRNVKTTLTVDNKNPNAGEDVTFTLNIENEGNVPYTNMKVYMNGEEVDFPANNLKPGNSYSEDYVRSYDISTEVGFTITLKDHHGQTKSVNTNTISIQLPVDTNALSEKLKFNMSVDRPKLTSEGVITFSGNITNSSEYLLSEISVDDETLGNIFRADELPATSSKKIEFPSDINETTTYNFVLTVKDRDGKVYTVNAEPITVEITSAVIEDDDPDFDDAATVDEPTNELTLNGDEKNVGKLGILGIISIVLIVLILGVGVALIVLWKKGASTPSRSSGRKPAARPSAKRPPAKRKPAARKPTRNYKDRNNF